MLPLTDFQTCTLVLIFLSSVLTSSTADATVSCLSSNDSNVTTVTPCFVHQPLMTHLNPYNPNRNGVQVPSRGLEWGREVVPPYNSRVPQTHYIENEQSPMQIGGYNYPHGYSGPQPEHNWYENRPRFPPPGRSWNPFLFRPISPSWPSPFTRPMPPQYGHYPQNQYPPNQYPVSYPYVRPNSFLSGLFSKRTQPIYPATVTEEKPEPVYLGPGSLKLLDHRLAEITCTFSDSSNYKIISVSN